MRKTIMLGLVLILALALFTAGCSSNTIPVDDSVPNADVNTSTLDTADESTPVDLIEESDEVEIGEMI